MSTSSFGTYQRQGKSDNIGSVCFAALYNAAKHMMSSVYENAAMSSVPVLHLLKVDRMLEGNILNISIHSLLFNSVLFFTIFGARREFHPANHNQGFWLELRLELALGLGLG